MSSDLLASETELLFPSSDGKPMSENTRQYEDIVTLKGNIEAIVPADAFVAGDHLIYVDPSARTNDPERTDRQAPDVYVAFGRPRGHRGSYFVWEEGGVFPQVIFEVTAPSNTPTEMANKRAFYFRHGAEEYYEFDPEAGTWLGYVRNAATGLLAQVAEMDDHVSPRLGIRFAFQPMELRVFRPDGTPFLSFQELEDQRQAERQRADDAQRHAEEEHQRAEEEHQKAEKERQRADLAQKQAEEERRQRERALQQAEEAERRAAEERQRAEEERRQREVAQRRAEEERQRAEEERRQGDVARQEAERLRALLRAKGIEPDDA